MNSQLFRDVSIYLSIEMLSGKKLSNNWVFRADQMMLKKKKFPKVLEVLMAVNSLDDSVDWKCTGWACFSVVCSFSNGTFHHSVR